MLVWDGTACPVDSIPDYFVLIRWQEGFERTQLHNPTKAGVLACNNICLRGVPHAPRQDKRIRRQHRDMHLCPVPAGTVERSYEIVGGYVVDHEDLLIIPEAAIIPVGHVSVRSYGGRPEEARIGHVAGRTVDADDASAAGKEVANIGEIQIRNRVVR